MNACILAGGAGSRLRPLTCTRPKPMVPLFDRPMLSYTLENLQKAGVKRCFITLMYLPDAIPAYFGDRYGDMELIYHVEEKSMGSAGGILAFREALKDEDFLVVSGDAVFDFDLAEAMSVHRSSGNQVTLVVTQSNDPTSFGMVSMDPSGKITAFLEKPTWEQTSGGLVNTGLYVMSPIILDRIPSESPFDFSKDLFPLLLASGTLGAASLPGYWRDVGTPEAYRSVTRDALDGIWKPSLPLLTAKAPRGVEVIHPFFLSPKARVAEGTRLGPYAVIGANANIGPNCSISHSYVNGKLEEGVSLTGAIVDRGSRIGADSILLGGSILGEGAILGRGSLLENNVHVWCNAVVERGSHLFPGTDAAGLTFRHRIHVHQGHVHRLTPGDALDLAYSMWEAGFSKIAVGFSKSNATASILANTFTSGFLSCGGQVVCHDAGFAASAAWMGRMLKSQLSIWFEGDEVLVFNSHGRLATGKELQFPIHSFHPDEDVTATQPQYVMGCDLLYGKRFSSDQKLPLRVYSTDSRLLPVLDDSGVLLSPNPDGVVLVSGDLYGIRLSVSDEKGYAFTSDEGILLLILCELLAGRKAIRIPDHAPVASENLASEYGATVTRIGSSNEELPDWYCHASAAAILIFQTMHKTGRSLSSLASSIPPCFTVTKSFRAPDGRIAALNRFAKFTCDQPHTPGNGIKISVHGATVQLHASSMEDFMVLKTESNKEEMANEICGFYYRLLAYPSEGMDAEVHLQDLS